MLNYINLQKEKKINEEDKVKQIDENEFQDEVLKVNVKDYYFHLLSANLLLHLLVDMRPCMLFEFYPLN